MFVVSKTSLETGRADEASFKRQVARVDMEKADSDKAVAAVCEKLEHCMIRLNVAIVGRDRAEKLPRALATKLVNTVKAVLHQLGYDAAGRLRQERGRAYTTLSLLCPVALTLVSGATATRTRWKG